MNSSIIKKFIGLSRMSHSVLDIAHPAAGALLALSIFPNLKIIIFGLISAFAGFTAVFALNDLLDAKTDEEKMQKSVEKDREFDLDSLGQRHPLAQGELSKKAALAWVVFWGLVSLIFAFLLKPICVLLLILAAGIEIAYCLLLKVTHWKSILSGLMVAVGGLAGVYAVSDKPSLVFVIIFILWAGAWEIGGRNIANDWSDIKEDKPLGIKTFPIVFGQKKSTYISLIFAALSFLSSLAFTFITNLPFRYLYLILATLSGLYFIIMPGLGWLKKQHRESALKYFNRACFYPMSVFVSIALCLLIELI